MVKRPSKIQKITIDLDGPQGNGLHLISVAKSLTKQLYGYEKSLEVSIELLQKPHKEILEYLEREFGYMIIFLTENDDYIRIIENATSEVMA